MKIVKAEISKFVKEHSEVIAEIISSGKVAEIDTSKDGVKIMAVEKKKVG